MKKLRKSIRRTAKNIKIGRKKAPERPPTPPPPRPSATADKPWRVLITGGAGHVAQQLVAQLEDQVRDQLTKEVGAWMTWEFEHNQKQHIPAKSVKRRRDNLIVLIDQEVEKLLRTRLQIVLVDVFDIGHSSYENHVALVKGSFTNETKMKTALERVDTVFHLAAVGMTGYYARDRAACLAINSIGTMKFLNWCKIQGVQRFVYVSSIGTIFDGKPLINSEENHGVYPDKHYNHYCESKRHAELIVYKATSDQMKTIILRFNGIYGPGEKRVTERVVNFMKSGWWIATCKPKGVEAVTQLSSVGNCVQALIKADVALRYADAKQGRIYNIMDRNPVGTFSFWNPLNEGFGFSPPFLTIHPYILRVLAYICEIIAFIFRLDPLFSVLELDLLCVTTTFSLDRAIRELYYRPEDSPMNEIVEMYVGRVKKKDLYGNPTAEFTEEWKKFLQRRTYFLKFMAFLAFVGVIVTSYYGFHAAVPFIEHYRGYFRMIYSRIILPIIAIFI
uniref:3Beta_HSD domain-containing protein n=1 Tax=Caenorhabditis tropicalis TaxID=1561998 RepID=A0A1I7T728_9PELO